MTRIDDLQERYPGIPRDIILRNDCLVQGIRDSKDLDKVGVWTGALWLYQSMDYDVPSFKEIAEKTPEKVREGRILRHPESLRFSSGFGSHIRIRSTSPYVVREEGEGRFALYDGEERIQDVYFILHKQRTTPEPVTSKGTPISALIDFQPRCACITPMRHCQYFTLGQSCKFCNLNASHADARASGLDDPVTIDLEETAEAFKIRSSEVRQLEVSIVMGGLLDAEREVKVFADFVEKIANAAPHKPVITVRAQSLSRKDFCRLRDAGLDTYSVQIEVMDPVMFPQICPGKARRAPYERWIESFHDGVDVFGFGKMGGKLVPGITLFAPNGHQTWQEARDYQIEATRWLIKNGMVPCSMPLWWAPGSVLSEEPSNVAKFPPTEYHLEVALAHHEAMLQYGLYEKMDKFMFCGLDCSVAGYSADIGMITQAGDVGKWMSDVVPDEDNWLAKFIDSVKSPARSQ